MFLASGEPNFDFVCPSNCNNDSGILTEMMPVNPSRTSAPSRFLSFVFSKPYFLAYSLNTFVKPDLNPVS